MGDFLFNSFKKTFLRASLKLSEFIVLVVGKIIIKEVELTGIKSDGRVKFKQGQ